MRKIPSWLVYVLSIGVATSVVTTCTTRAHANPDEPGRKGACCLGDDTCVNVGSEASCVSLNGVYLEGEECASSPCGVGACCFMTNCAQATAFSCVTAGREFAGAGTSCLDDPCGAGIGACCLPLVCDDLSPEDCADQGGTWLGAGTSCATGPCDEGACCLDRETCFETIGHECFLMGGVFVIGDGCLVNPCGGPSECPEDTIFSQSRDEPDDDFQAGTSESSPGLQRFDSFKAVPGSIEALTWWGLDLEFDGGVFIDCVESDPRFEISFHEDAGGRPGAVHCTYLLHATRTPLGIFYNGMELNEYEVTLPSPCVMVNGWISIVGLGDPDCWFLWMSSGNNGSYCDGCMAPVESYGLSFCLRGPVGGVFGACCLDATEECLENVEIVECLAADARFLEGVLCRELDPPCGVIRGACCFPDATCLIEEEESCSALGGSWLGANTLCIHCPCITPCPAGGIAEGEPVCTDGTIDQFNSGCFGAPEVFSPIALGDSVCGTSGVFLLNNETVGDFDWYEVILPEPQQIEWSVTGEFPTIIRIYDGRRGCPAPLLAESAALECDTSAVTATAPAGVIWLMVGPFTATDTSKCGARYVATLTRGGCPGDIDRDGEVGFADLLMMLAAWGPCPDCPEDLDGNGVVAFGDLLMLLAAWGPCVQAA